MNGTRTALIAAIIEADGGPDDDDQWEAENMADDILATPSGRKITAAVEAADAVVQWASTPRKGGAVTVPVGFVNTLRAAIAALTT